MSKRFGRNKKRELLKQIEDLNLTNQSLQAELSIERQKKVWASPCNSVQLTIQPTVEFNDRIPYASPYTSYFEVRINPVPVISRKIMTASDLSRAQENPFDFSHMVCSEIAQVMAKAIPEIII